jgi:hypothetical protein
VDRSVRDTTAQRQLEALALLQELRTARQGEKWVRYVLLGGPTAADAADVAAQSPAWAECAAPKILEPLEIDPLPSSPAKSSHEVVLRPSALLGRLQVHVSPCARRC